MSNVLPQEARLNVWRMYRARFLIAASLILITSGVLAGLALMPSYLVLQVGNRDSAKQLPANAPLQQDRVAVARTQALLTVLTPLLSSTTTTQLIAKAITARPADIEIDHIATTAGHPGTLIVSGVASNIESINAYQNALRSGKVFSSVSVPVADLAGTADGQFSITLSADF